MAAVGREATLFRPGNAVFHACTIVRPGTNSQFHLVDERHLGQIVEMIAPQGRFGLIDGTSALDISTFSRKSVSVHPELMFTRSIFNTADVGEQGELLNEVSRLVDAGTLRSTMTERHSPIDAVNLKRVHALIESGTTRGKIVLEGFGMPA